MYATTVIDCLMSNKHETAVCGGRSKVARIPRPREWSDDRIFSFIKFN